MRITVYGVLDYLASGMTEAEILQDFPHLTSEDIRACIAFAADRERKLITIPGETAPRPKPLDNCIPVDDPPATLCGYLRLITRPRFAVVIFRTAQ